MSRVLKYSYQALDLTGLQIGLMSATVRGSQKKHMARDCIQALL